MTTALKRTIIVLIAIFVVELFAFSNIFSTNNIAIAGDMGEPPILEASDLALDKATLEVASEEGITEEVISEDSTPATEDYEYYDYDYDYAYNYGYENYNTYSNYTSTDGKYSAAEFQQLGVLHDGTWSYTYYSERVLPGGGLAIPGRHTDSEGYVCDENNYVCVASDDLPKGTVVTLPVSGDDGESRTGVVYDTGSGYGNLDIYTSW